MTLGVRNSYASEIMETKSRSVDADLCRVVCFNRRKIEALRCHKSQLDPGDGQWIRDWAAEAGKAANLAFAEGFRVMKLVSEENSVTPEA